MKHTVIALFDDAGQAQQAPRALAERGFDRAAVHVTLAEPGDVVVPPAANIEGGPVSGLLNRLSALFNVEEPHVSHYVEAVRRGGNVVQVDASDEAQAVAARDVLVSLGAVDIDDRVQAWMSAGWAGAAAGAEGAGVAPRRVVHRQEVSIAGVRVYGEAAPVSFDAFAADFRSDHATRYAGQGTSYDDLDPAYRFGHALAVDARNDGGDWTEIELEAREEWERRYPQSAWERAKGAVRHAWERVTGR